MIFSIVFPKNICIFDKQNTIHIMKIKKVFYYNNIKLKIVDRLEQYMNSKEQVEVTRVIAPNGKIFPISIRNKESLKSIQERVMILIDQFHIRGANIEKELTE